MGDVKFLPEMLGVGGWGGSGFRNGGIDFIMGEWGREILST